MSELRWRLVAIVATTSIVGVVLALLAINGYTSEYPTAALDESFARVALVVAGAMLLGSTLGAVAVFAAATSTADALHHLALHARQSARGARPGHVETIDDVDIADLATAINQMADALGAQLRAVEAERARLAAVLATMADGVIMVDADNRIALINAAAAQLLSTTAETAEGRSLIDVARDYELATVASACLSGKEPEPRVIDLGQPRRDVQVVATPLPTGVVGRHNALLVLQDVTELRRTETVRREFVANVSHELRTPVAGLKALAETLHDGALEDPPAARTFLARMLIETDRLAQMVEELLELARLEGGRVPLEQQPLNLGALVTRSAERLRPQAERKGVDLIVEASPSGLHVQGDATRLERVFVNLVDNAVKFTPPGGQVRVGCSQRDGEALISVMDTGPGIPRADLPRIFERFYKVDRARSSNGTGLGLAIAKHTIVAQGGQIWAESVEGKGATFLVRLPIDTA